MNILYVEDNMLNMQLIKKSVRSLGYNLIEAYDGKSGVVSASQNMPDMIFVDINLPDMSGIEVARRIKQNPTLAHIPIYALTADGTTLTRRLCDEAGIEDILLKPISRTLLLKTLQQAAAMNAVHSS